MPRYVKLKLTVLEADALRQLAEEASFETFVSDDRPRREQTNRGKAGSRALEKLCESLGFAAFRPCPRPDS